MPRRSKPARLYLDRHRGEWVIRHGRDFCRTGCGERDRDGAHAALRAYLAERFEPRRRAGDPHALRIAEILTAYGREHAPHRKAPATIGYALAALLPFWGARRLVEINGTSCREYGEHRQRSAGTVRRELGVLAAAVKHWHREHGPLSSVPVVTLPPAGAPRQRWLERDEAVRLVAGALGFFWSPWCDVATRRPGGRWRRLPGRRNVHLARFILLGLATGSRAGVLLSLRWMPSTIGGWVDLERGIVHRAAAGEAQTTKRKPPARLGRRILRYLRAWQRADEARRAAGPGRYINVVTIGGEPISSVRRSWAAARDLAYLGADVTPHILRHTRATWLMQGGVDTWEASGALGMSVRTLERVYAHHHPDWQRSAAEI